MNTDKTNGHFRGTSLCGPALPRLPAPLERIPELLVLPDGLGLGFRAGPVDLVEAGFQQRDQPPVEFAPDFHLMEDPQGSSRIIPLRYGRSSVMAVKTSATAMSLAPSGRSSA